MAGRVRVLVVDDSAYMRVILKDILEADPGIIVAGVAKNGLEAVEKTKALSPDVVTLDIQMPKMDGVATLQRIMKECPTRVLMLSAMDRKDDQLPLKAIKMGAVDFISKPGGPVSVEIMKFKEKIVEIVKVAAMAKLDVLKRAPAPPPARLRIQRKSSDGPKAVVIGASTGGPRALESLFAALPKDLPAPMFVVQHLPPEFAKTFARRLNAAGGPVVEVATEGLRPERGKAYLAPGGRHLVVSRTGSRTYLMRLEDREPVRFVKPSADVLFSSVAQAYGSRVLGVVMTGMGSDGASGARQIKFAGGTVVVQDEQSSVIFGMAKAVVDAGAADKVLPLDAIAGEIVRFLED
jgi:two-component system chemotaxis response regulator CheB